MLKTWVIVPCFNAPDLLAACLASIRQQTGRGRFEVYVSDDASTDPQVGEVLDDFDQWDDFTILRSEVNRGATRNIVDTIRHVETTCDFDMDDLIVLVDGDDRLADPGSLARIRAVFDGTDTLVAYGGYVADPPDDACPPARELPPDILTYGMVRAFTRDHGPWFNHPLAFRRRAFDVLRADDFTGPDGEWLRYGYDVTLMTPMLEAAGERVAFMEDVTYVYTSSRPDSVHRVHEAATNVENDWVLSQRRRYQPLEDPCVTPS